MREHLNKCQHRPWEAFIGGLAGWAQRPGNLAGIGLADGVWEAIRRERGGMSHRHFCDVAGHWWEGGGTALCPEDNVPSLCVCMKCRDPLEFGGLSHGMAELLACPRHRKVERRIFNSC